jgi:hypothetical protein
MLNKRPPVDKRSVSKRDFDRLPKFQEGGLAGSVLNRILPSEQKKIEETSKYYDTYNELVNQYNQSLKDYEDQYNAATAAYNLRAKDYETRYNTETDKYNRALEDYNKQVGLFQTQQVDPYNAALAQYQQQVQDYQNKALAYDQQALAAQKAYDQQYGDYERQYQDYLKQYGDYEKRYGAYEPVIAQAQGQLDAYTRPYAKDLRGYLAENDYYNYVYNDIYSRNMSRANDYASRAQRMREDPWWMMYEGQFGRTPESYDQLAAGLRSQAEVVIPDINRSAESMERYQASLQKGGFSFDQYNSLVNNLNTVAQKAPTAPTFSIQAPVLDIKPFGEQVPTFTQQAPVFSLQQPTFTFNEAAPTFDFTQQAPERPKDPEMTPEQLQEYQARAQKLAGYRATGLEKAFEMGIAPEVAQYFKRGIM